MRLSILNAIVWRAISEIHRRHSPGHRFAVFESHPGISARGRLHLVLLGTDQPVTRCAQAIFNLGGPSGTVDIAHANGAREEGLPLARPMLEGDPVEAVDAIGRGLGLRKPPALGPSSAPTIAVRLIADVLARESLARRPLRVTSGWVDTSFGCSNPAWTSLLPAAIDDDVAGRIPAVNDWHRGLITGGHLVALHEASRDETPLMACDERPLAIVDIVHGRMALAKGPGTPELIDLQGVFAANGRRLAALAETVLLHLGR